MTKEELIVVMEEHGTEDTQERMAEIVKLAMELYDTDKDQVDFIALKEEFGVEKGIYLMGHPFEDRTVVAVKKGWLNESDLPK